MNTGLGAVFALRYANDATASTIEHLCIVAIPCSSFGLFKDVNVRRPSRLNSGSSCLLISYSVEVHDGHRGY